MANDANNRNRRRNERDSIRGVMIAGLLLAIFAIAIIAFAVSRNDRNATTANSPPATSGQF
jgi:hypothetical protein